MAADLLVFDPGQGTGYGDVHQAAFVSDGMPYVIVNGKVAIDDGRFTEENEQVLRHRAASMVGAQ